jgi:hypothetical protein
MLPEDGPLLPAAKAGKMSAARQAWTESWYHRSPPGPPQELLTTCGRMLGSPWSGVPPTGNGARIHSAEASRSALLQEDVAQPLAAIQVACGAIPI